MNTLQSEWESYAAEVMEKDRKVSAVQYDKTRKAFYGGATAMFGLMAKAGEDDVSEEAGAAMFDGLNQELLAFMDEMKARVKAEQAGSNSK